MLRVWRWCDHEICCTNHVSNHRSIFVTNSLTSKWLTIQHPNLNFNFSTISNPHRCSDNSIANHGTERASHILCPNGSANVGSNYFSN